MLLNGLHYSSSCALRKVMAARLASVKGVLAFALEDAYDIFSEDSESNQKIQTLKTAYKLFTNEQYKVST